MSTTENAEPLPVTEQTTEAPIASTEEPKETSNANDDETTEAEKPKSNKKTSAGGNKKIARGGRPSSGNGTKKQAPAESSNKSLNTGDIVLARLKGYPPWPARIVDYESVSAVVKSQRPPRSTAHFCVQYFPRGDHSWLVSKEITPLHDHEIKAWLEQTHRKSTPNGLRAAYETAKDPSEWISKLAPVDDEPEAEEEEEDQLEDDAEEVGGGKRKRAAEKKDRKKAAKVNKKAKKSTAAVESEEEPPVSKAKAKPVKSSAATKKEKADAKVEPENQAAADEDPLASDPEAVKVKDWRHKLQRAFLGKGLPSAEEMGTYDELFKTIESYEHMSIEYLQHSKIGKVMKKIATLTAIPKNDELKITDRAAKLMNDWSEFIAKSENKEANGNGDANGTGTEAAAAAAANGDADAKPNSSKADAEAEA